MQATTKEKRQKTVVEKSSRESKPQDLGGGLGGMNHHLKKNLFRSGSRKVLKS